MAIGAADIECDVRHGTQRDAVLFSCSANSAHGQRRTNDDTRRAELRLLHDPEWRGWSDREIARRASVGHPFVAGLRPPVTGNNSSEERTYTTRHGTTATMNTAGINADRARPQAEQEDDADDEPPAAAPLTPPPAPIGPTPARVNMAAIMKAEAAWAKIAQAAAQDGSRTTKEEADRQLDRVPAETTFRVARRRRRGRCHQFGTKSGCPVR